MSISVCTFGGHNLLRFQTHLLGEGCRQSWPLDCTYPWVLVVRRSLGCHRSEASLLDIIILSNSIVYRRSYPGKETAFIFFYSIRHCVLENDLIPQMLYPKMLNEKFVMISSRV